MTCIYDVLLNFTDDDNLIDFFEWHEKDDFDHIKKIYLVRVNTKTMEDFLKYKIKVSEEFLSIIKDKTILYKNKKYLKYAALFTDLNKVIALEFDNNGEVVAKSSLLLDEEEDIIMESNCMDEENIEYEKILEYPKRLFLTREELYKRLFLLKEIENAYKENDYDKLTYYYDEIYENNNYSIDKKYELMIDEIKNAYCEKHNNLYEIIRMSYTRR